MGATRSKINLVPFAKATREMLPQAGMNDARGTLRTELMDRLRMPLSDDLARVQHDLMAQVSILREVDLTGSGLLLERIGSLKLREEFGEARGRELEKVLAQVVKAGEASFKLGELSTAAIALAKITERLARLWGLDKQTALDDSGRAWQPGDAPLIMIYNSPAPNVVEQAGEIVNQPPAVNGNGRHNGNGTVK